MGEEASRKVFANTIKTAGDFLGGSGVDSQRTKVDRNPKNIMEREGGSEVGPDPCG